MENQNNGQLNHLLDTLLQLADRLTSLQNSQNNDSEGKVSWIFRSNKQLTAACIPVLILTSVCRVELTNHSEGCSIRAGLTMIGPAIQWVDQWSSRGVGQGTRAHKTAGNRTYTLINYAEPTQLWNVWLLKLSNQNHAVFFPAKSVGANGFSYFLFLFFARENEIIWRPLEDGKSEERPSQKRKTILKLFVELARWI